ncbi:hypothetical protein [Rhodosalinus sp. 5P4]|uniref:hypothetical protein n=1 Tax=Rhodosalinus sp. 5P4 TaxID=3239196 RepID=UPI0035253EA2
MTTDDAGHAGMMRYRICLVREAPDMAGDLRRARGRMAASRTAPANIGRTPTPARPA